MVIEESKLKFEFPEENNTIKFDDTKFYREYFNKLPEGKGVDFITLNNGMIAFIEVKNCTGDEGNCRWRIATDNKKKNTTSTTIDVTGRDSLDIEVSQKVAMTLAALAGAKSFGDRKESLAEIKELVNSFSEKILRDDKKKKYVILFLEGDFASHTKSKKMIMSALQKSISRKLEWFDCKVSVVDSDTYDGKIFEIIK